MKRVAYLTAVVAVALLPLGCKKSKAADRLPPAAGSAAPRLSGLPKIEVEEAATRSNGLLTVTGSTHPIKEATLGPASGVLGAAAARSPHGAR